MIDKIRFCHPVNLVNPISCTSGTSSAPRSCSSTVLGPFGTDAVDAEHVRIVGRGGIHLAQPAVQCKRGAWRGLCAASSPTIPQNRPGTATSGPSAWRWFCSRLGRLHERVGAVERSGYPFVGIASTSVPHPEVRPGGGPTGWGTRLRRPPERGGACGSSPRRASWKPSSFGWIMAAESTLEHGKPTTRD